MVELLDPDYDFVAARRYRSLGGFARCLVAQEGYRSKLLEASPEGGPVPANEEHELSIDANPSAVP